MQEPSTRPSIHPFTHSSPALLVIGVDVAKAELVIRMGPQKPFAIANDEASIKRWLTTVPRHALIGMESTGRYHALLATLASQAGLAVYVLNARDIHFYAKALGARAKTDRVDADVIARYLAEHHARLHRWCGGEEVQRRLHQLLQARAEVVKHRGALEQVFKALDLAQTDIAGLQHQFESVLARLDARVQELLRSDQDLADTSQRLRTVTGIGPQTAAWLTSLLSRIPFANADALVAYCGLDPRAQDSGSRSGRRRLSKKGPPWLRRQVYLMGFAASHSKLLKPLYQTLRSKGFATTQAFIILGRKLLRAAYAVWKSKMPFDPTKLGLGAAGA